MANLGPGRAALAVALVVVLACGAAAVAQPAAPQLPTSVSATVATSVLACPPAPRGGSTKTEAGIVTVDAAVADAEEPAEGPIGTASLVSLRGEGVPLVAVETAPAVAAVTVRKARSVVARAEGQLAPNLGAGLVAEVRKGRGRGLMASACAAPSAEAWFVGGGSLVGRRTTVRLTNPDSSPALVDVAVYGPRGPVDAGRGEGVEVPPHSSQSLRLDVLAPGNGRTAVHVVARAGRVSSSVADVNTLGLIPRGADFVPAAAPPALSTVVPGLSGAGGGKRLLQVLAPGETDAIIEVRVVAADGTFAPESAAVLEVAAGTVGQVDLASALAGAGPSALLLTSDTPVVAGVRSAVPQSERAVEVSYSAGSPTLSGPASFGPIWVDESHAASVVLTSVETEGLVEISVVSPDGEVSSQQVLVAAGSTQRVVLGPAAKGSALLLTPVGAAGAIPAVVSAVQLSVEVGGDLLASTVPLASGVSTVTVPPVRPDPATGVPGH